MNKVDIQRTYAETLMLLGLSSNEMILGAGGALVMLGIRDRTSDLDVNVRPAYYDQLLLNGHEETIDGDFIYITINGVVDIHRGDDVPMEGMYVDGVFIEHPCALLDFKKKLNRPKDQSDITGLVQYMLEAL